MPKLHFYFDVVLLWLWAVPAFACSCAWGGPFMDVARGADVVAIVKIDSYGPPLQFAEARQFMTTSVIETLVGKPGETMTVYGDNGMLCRPYITHASFPVGTQFILAVYKNRGDIDYALSGCGAYWLPFADGKVTGQIRSRDPESMTYDEFKKRFDKKLDRDKK